MKQEASSSRSEYLRESAARRSAGRSETQRRSSASTRRFVFSPCRTTRRSGEVHIEVGIQMVRLWIVDYDVVSMAFEWLDGHFEQIIQTTSYSTIFRLIYSRLNGNRVFD